MVRFLSQGVMGVGASDDKNDVYVKLAFGGWNAQTAVENNAGDKAVFDYDVDGRHVGDAKSMRWRSTVGEVRCYVTAACSCMSCAPSSYSSALSGPVVTPVPPPLPLVAAGMVC